MTGGDGGEERREKSMWMQAAEFGAVGIEMGLAVTVGYFAGHWLDGKFGTEPWLTIVLLLAGVGAAFSGLIRVARRAWRDTQSDGPSSGGEGGAEKGQNGGGPHSGD